MEEDSVELIDYLRIIWKRKILIIVGILLCMGGGGGVSKTKFPDIYRAETLILIGKALSSYSYSYSYSTKETSSVPLSFSSSPSFDLIDTPESLQTYIPIMYGIRNGESQGYSLEIARVSDTSILKLIVKGPNRERAEELLKGVVDRIIENHRKKLEQSIDPYSVLMANTEEDIKNIQEDISVLETSLKNMITSDIDLKTIVQTQNNMWLLRNNLRILRQKNLEYTTIIGSLRENNTKVISTTEASKIVMPSHIRRNVLIGGAVGLMISIFLAFIIEYVGKEMERARGKIER